MKLKDLLLTIKYGTNVCICDELGSYNDTCPVEKLSIMSIINDLDREVEDIYIDPSDMSITIDLFERNYNEEK